ncbi:MAG: hypothetical protein OHK0015_24210 [Chloroflexi bacterium OHK40]
MPRRPPPRPPQPRDDNQVDRGQVRALLAEAQALSARLAALNEVAAAMQASLEFERVLETAAREARWLLDFQYCSVTERLGESYYERVLKGPTGAMPTPVRRPLDDSPLSTAMRLGHATLLRDATAAGRLAPGMQSGLIVPLRAGGEVIGTLNFFAERPESYSYDDLRVVSALAAQLSAAAQNSRLYREVTDARNELQIVLESISDGVLVLSEAGHVLLANPAARRMFHLASLPLERHVLTAAAQLRVRGQRLIPIAQLRTALAQFHRERRGVLHLSTGTHIEWAAAPLSGGASMPGFVVSFRDISDKVALEELRDDMISMLVHDLRTPLNGLMLSLDMLGQSRRSGSQEYDEELIERAGQSARQLLRHVNTLLDLRKLEAGRLELDIQPIRAGALIQRVVPRFELLAELGRIALKTEMPPGLPVLAVDHALVERVLENLLGNALKFTPEGRSVTVGARRHASDPNWVELFVRDEGIGIPPELRSLVFEKFGQVQSALSRRGTGLGLTFCKLAVEAHGGQIGVRDTPGGGSTFWLTLPVSAAS